MVASIYSGTSLMRTPLGSCPTVLIIEVSLVWRLTYLQYCNNCISACITCTETNMRIAKLLIIPASMECRSGP